MTVQPEEILNQSKKMKTVTISPTYSLAMVRIILKFIQFNAVDESCECVIDFHMFHYLSMFNNICSEKVELNENIVSAASEPERIHDMPSGSFPMSNDDKLIVAKQPLHSTLLPFDVNAMMSIQMGMETYAASLIWPATDLFI